MRLFFSQNEIEALTHHFPIFFVFVPFFCSTQTRYAVQVLSESILATFTVYQIIVRLTPMNALHFVVNSHIDVVYVDPSLLWRLLASRLSSN